ncbi:MAG: cation:dicarboxylase symporter family transporter, partial [Gemmatimonas sp.]
MKESTRVLAALGLAIVLGALISASGNATLLRAADALAPIGTLWVNAIRMTVIPLVVALLITGIASASDLKAIGRLGARTLGVFILLLVIVSAVMIPLAALVFNLLPPGVSAKPALPSGAAEAAIQLAGSGGPPTAAAWLTSLIPTNPIAAAANGAMLPLVLFTLLFALAIASSSATARDAILPVFRAIGEAMLVLVRWVIMLAPVGVFALVLPLTA